MARTSYRNFLKLLEQWPADPTKSKGRDLGEYLRLRVTEGFKHGDATQVDEAECSRIHASLTRIATNTYAKNDLPKLLTRLKVHGSSFDGVLMDVGASSIQFDTPLRGFMLSKDGPLDMRMDGDRDPESVRASDVIGHCDEAELYKVLKFYGEEKHARKLARALIEARYLFRQPRTTKELADLVAEIIGSDTRMDKLQRFAHPATKTFQALRILVNNELNELDYAMRLAHYYLKPGGVLAAITFHSLEDTIVKRHIAGVDIDQTPASIGLGVAKHRTGLSLHSREEMQKLTAARWSPLAHHVILPSEDEISCNPRARSAKLRTACKLEPV